MQSFISTIGSCKYLYVLDGANDNAIPPFYDTTTLVAPIDSQGNIGSFSPDTSMPTPLNFYASIVVAATSGKFIYTLGGRVGNDNSLPSTTTIYRASLPGP